jgi:adenine-specific DNA-methyltransferase
MESTAPSIQLLDQADNVRRRLSGGIAIERRSALGQFMTPASVARFMASLFPPSALKSCLLLDAGAGLGALTCAFLDRWASHGGLSFQKVEVEAYEIDANLRKHLTSTLTEYARRLPLGFRVIPGDFIEATAMQSLTPGPFTHAILNPPYRKINSSSSHRLILRQVGIETVNLYSAFVALSLDRLKCGGQLVAIVPRSFCNGPYYRPFRDFLLRRAALRHMHLFASRSKAFKDDDVLQENLIIRLEAGATQGNVAVSHSTDDTFSDLTTHEQPFGQIVFPDDPERFIHVPTSTDQGITELPHGIRSTLADLEIGISTGPVVDFRLRHHIEPQPRIGTIPLLYPGHFSGQLTMWPKEGIKRGNAIRLNSETRKWLYPNGFYTVVRRFSSKEESRRIVASVVKPDSFPGAPMLGFENHLNVFHQGRHGLPEALAYGLAAYLNTSAVDQSFRRFSGHTQVNATDLRLMRYPDRKALMALGRWAKGQESLSQAMVDDQIKKLTE